MITFTKEQLIASAHARIEFAEMMLAGEFEPLKERTWSIKLELARIALASLEAEPVAWAHRLINKRNGVVHPWVYGSAEACPSEGDIFNIEVMPLYTAPPAPISVPAAMEMDDDFDSSFEHGKAVGWNAYRAAMLQGAENAESTTTMQTAPELDYSPKNAESPTGINQGKSEPVTTAYKLPDDFDFDRFNDVVWLEAVASNPHMHSLTTSTIAMVALELNRKLAGCNSPVIPDEVLSAIRKVARIRADFDDFDGDRRGIGDCLDEAEQELIVTINKHASVIAAAPQQEA